MHIVADYEIITDGPFTLDGTKYHEQVGGVTEKSFDFTLKPGARPGFRSILSFVLRNATSGSSLNDFEVKINGVSQKNYSLHSQINPITLHEVVGDKVLKIGMNRIDFRLVLKALIDTGKLTITDAVLHYKRELEIL